MGGYGPILQTNLPGGCCHVRNNTDLTVAGADYTGLSLWFFRSPVQGLSMAELMLAWNSYIRGEGAQPLHCESILVRWMDRLHLLLALPDDEIRAMAAVELLAYQPHHDHNLLAWFTPLPGTEQEFVPETFVVKCNFQPFKQLSRIPVVWVEEWPEEGDAR